MFDIITKQVTASTVPVYGKWIELICESDPLKADIGLVHLNSFAFVCAFIRICMRDMSNHHKIRKGLTLICVLDSSLYLIVTYWYW